MPPRWITTVVKPEDYLRRLGVPELRESSRNVLRELHIAHLENVPFENLDIARGIEIVLDEERLLVKIVRHRRGGFCYELNGAFAWLLGRLGYRVTLLSAEVARKDGGFGIPFDHMALRVDVDGSYLADVGFGDSFREPLPLDAGREIAQLDDVFRLARAGPWWILERCPKGESAFEAQYRFTLAPRKLEDFAPGCRYHQTSPRSSFTQGPICSRALPEGRVTLHRDRLVLRTGGRCVESPVAGPDQWTRLLEERFGIRLPEPAHVFPQN